MTSTPALTTDDAMQLALMHHQAGRLVDAAHWYRVVLETTPDHGDANHNLGLLLGATEGVSAALPYLAKAASIEPVPVQYAISYSSFLLDAGHIVEAAALLDQTFARGMESAALRCNRGNAARALDQIDEAEAQFRLALRLDPQYALAWYNLGGVLQDKGELNDAVDAYRNARQFAPDLTAASNNLALALQALGHTDEAITVLAQVLSRHPDDADGYRKLAALLEADGRDEGAWQCYARAIALAPGVADTAYRAGLVLRRLGKPYEAVTHFRFAVDADDSHAQAYNELGNVQLQLGQQADALKSYTTAVTKQPDFADAFSNLGNALLLAGSIAEAESACLRAVELAPTLPEAQFNLGNVLRAAHRQEAAIAAYRQAVALRPDYAAAWCNLGLVLQAFDRTEAEACCRQALQHDPELPQALVFLADIVSEQGKFGLAEQLLRQAIVIAPDMAAAWAGLSGLRKMTEADRPWLEKAKQLIAGNLAIHEAAHLQFSIGKFLDDVENYDAAFAHYQLANDLSKRFTPAYDATTEAGTVDDACNRFTHQFFISRKGANDSALPIFVVGMPRSGTSLTEQIIAAHSQSFGAGELPFWSLAAGELEDINATGFEKHLSRLAGDYISMLSKIAPQASRIVDKFPGNFRHLGLIHAALPQARIIHMQRGPVDTCLSIYFQHFGEAHSYANDLDNLADYYQQYRRLMAHWRTVIGPANILEIEYEGLVADQEKWTRTILDFIGLPWDPACLDFHNAARTVGTASKWQVRQKMNKASIARWRHYESHIAALRRLQ